MSIFPLSENEESILETLWREARPLSRSEIIDNTIDKKWKVNSFYGLLNNLLEKKLVKVDSIVETGKTFGRAYVPSMSKEKYNQMKIEAFIDTVSPSKDVIAPIISKLVDKHSFTLDDIEALKKIIENK